MKNQRLGASVIAALIALTGCYEGEQVKEAPKTYDVESILNATELSNEQKSEMLAQVGESLSTPIGFMYADEVLNQALKLDRTNPRAQFYKHVIAPVMKLRGAIRGMRPLVDKTTDITRGNFDTLVSELEKNQPVYNFLTDGPANIADEAQAQALLDRVYQAQNDLRLFLRGPFKQTVIKLSPVIVNANTSEYLSQCEVKASGRRNGYHAYYEVSPCGMEFRLETTVDNADIEVMQHVFAGVQIATIMATSYDMTGAVAFEHYDRAGTDRTHSEYARFIHQLSKLGQLRGNAPLKIIHSMGSDLYAGARWAEQYQDRLCPHGHGHNNRPGRFINDGLCVQEIPGTKGPKIESLLRVFSAALAGTTTNIGIKEQRAYPTDLTDKKDFEFQARANVLAPINKPVADLKSLLPTVFSSCGKALNVGDSTMGGLFPDGNANDVASRLGRLDSSCN